MAQEDRDIDPALVACVAGLRPAVACVVAAYGIFHTASGGKQAKSFDGELRTVALSLPTQHYRRQRGSPSKSRPLTTSP